MLAGFPVHRDDSNVPTKSRRNAPCMSPQKNRPGKLPGRHHGQSGYSGIPGRGLVHESVEFLFVSTTLGILSKLGKSPGSILDFFLDFTDSVMLCLLVLIEDDVVTGILPQRPAVFGLVPFVGHTPGNIPDLATF